MLTRTFKILGIISLTIIGSIILIILCFWGSVKYGNYAKKKQAITYQKEVCDTIKTIQEDFYVRPYGFEAKAVKNLDFYLIRNGKIQQEKTIAVSSSKTIKDGEYIYVPFINFLRNDTVAVAIEKRFYILTGVDYDAEYNYGMFGPVGNCTCQLIGFKKINNKLVQNSRVLLEKKDGDTNFKLPKI